MLQLEGVFKGNETSTRERRVSKHSIIKEDEVKEGAPALQMTPCDQAIRNGGKETSTIEPLLQSIMPGGGRSIRR